MVSFYEVTGSWHLREPPALQFIISLCYLFLDTPNKCLLEKERVENEFCFLISVFLLSYF